LSNWQPYERKRGALEKRLIPKVKAALNQSISSFTSQLVHGVDAHTFFTYVQVYPVIAEIYMEAGKRFAAQTLIEIKKQMPRKKSLGFSHIQVEHKADVSTSGLSTKSDKFTEDVLNALRIAGLNLAQRISETTKKEVLEILAEGQKEGWGIDKIASEIVRRTGLSNRSRARTIARTEIGRASGVGKILAAKSFEVEMDKTWVGAADERERKTHWQMNDKSVDLDENFMVSGHPMQAPGDPSGPANETINCRCTMTFKVKKDPQGNIIPRYYYTPTNYTLPAPRSLRVSLGQIAEQIATGVSLGLMIRNAIDNGETRSN
jgi:hypothetical protein